MISEEIENNFSRKTAEAYNEEVPTFVTPISNDEIRLISVLELFTIDEESSTISDEDEYDSLDSCLDAYSLAEYIRSQPNKRQRIGNVQKDLRPMAFVRFNTSLGKSKPVTIKALLDSGASESLVSKKYAKKLRIKDAPKKSTVWTTPSGEMTTSQKVKAQFTIPELQDRKLIEWNLHVTKDMGSYDMILGRDILSFLKIDVRFSNQTVEWEQFSMPFKAPDATVETNYHIEESMAINTDTERM